MLLRIVIIILALALSAPAVPKTKPDQQVVTMDENLWVTFYDVPSRRFPNIRSSFIRREFGQAAHDLEASSAYLSIEADRSGGETVTPAWQDHRSPGLASG